MIKTVLALTTGSIIGLGFLTQDSDAPQERAEKQTRVEVKRIDEGDLSFTVQGESEMDEVVIKLVDSLAEMKLEMAEMTQKFGSKHPKIIQLKAKANVLNNLLQELRPSQVDGEAELAEGKELEEREVEGVYQFRFDSANGPIGIGKRNAAITLGVAGPADGARFPLGTRPGVFAVNVDSDPMSKYATKWSDASEEEREEIIQSVRETATQQFDEEMERREKELAEIKKRYERLQSLMDRRTEKREDIIEHYLENLQLEWDGLGFPAKGARRTSGFRSLYNFPSKLPAVKTGQWSEAEFFLPKNAPQAPKPPAVPGSPRRQ